MRVHTSPEWLGRTLHHPTLLKSPARGIVLHHSAGPNVAPGPADITRAFALARAIRTHHVQRNKWLDTGYHFIVTRGGLILEGRAGSYDLARQGKVILGAHSGDNAANRTIWGICAEGTYTDEEPPEALWRALVDLCAHLCWWGGVQSAAIYPHRRFRATECPGDSLAAMLTRLSREVHERKKAVSDCRLKATALPVTEARSLSRGSHRGAVWPAYEAALEARRQIAQTSASPVEARSSLGFVERFTLRTLFSQQPHRSVFKERDTSDPPCPPRGVSCPSPDEGSPRGRRFPAYLRTNER